MLIYTINFFVLFYINFKRMHIVKIMSYNFFEYIVNDVLNFKYVRNVDDFVIVNIVIVFILSLISFSFVYI